jgi:hypothetical protein
MGATLLFACYTREGINTSPDANPVAQSDLNYAPSNERRRAIYFFEAAALALRTRLTMVASSIRKARVMRWRTQPAQTEPP